MPALLWIGAIAACAALIATVVGCIPLAGLIAYTGANGVNNGSKVLSDPDKHFETSTLSDGWNWKDAAVTMATTTLAAVAPTGLWAPVAVGAGLGFGSDVVRQELDNPFTMPNWQHVACSTVGGGLAGMVAFRGVSKVVKGLVWNGVSEPLTAALTNVYSGQCGG
jgi:hypothetical protein